MGHIKMKLTRKIKSFFKYLGKEKTGSLIIDGTALHKPIHLPSDKISYGKKSGTIHIDEHGNFQEVIKKWRNRK